MRMFAGAPHLVVLAFMCVTAGAGAAHLAVLVSANFHMDINTPHLVVWSLTLSLSLWIVRAWRVGVSVSE